MPPPPKFGEFLICWFVPLDRQDERLGDFNEKFTKSWVPRFGARGAKIVYLAHLIWSAAAVVRITIFVAAMDRVMRAFRW